MIKEIEVEVPAVAAYKKKDYKYYCDKCGTEIEFPGSLWYPTICYHTRDIKEVDHEEMFKYIEYYHLCNDCIRKYIVNYLSEIGIEAHNQYEMYQSINRW